MVSEEYTRKKSKHALLYRVLSNARIKRLITGVTKPVIATSQAKHNDAIIDPDFNVKYLKHLLSFRYTIGIEPKASQRIGVPSREAHHPQSSSPPQKKQLRFGRLNIFITALVRT